MTKRHLFTSFFKKTPFLSLRRVLFVFFCTFILAGSSSYPSTFLGNLFFGKFPALYNVTLAQYFYLYASYPLLGKPSPVAHYQLARTLFIQGNLEASLNEATKEIALYPEFNKSYYLLGLIYGYMGNEQKAIDAFGTYIEKEPTTWAGRNDRAWLQFRIGDIDGALLTILPVASSTSNPWVQNTYGTLLMNKGNYAEARIAFESAKKATTNMKEKDWGYAYPGNDPRIYGEGLSSMRQSIENNLTLLTTKEEPKNNSSKKK